VPLFTTYLARNLFEERFRVAHRTFAFPIQTPGSPLTLAAGQRRRTFTAQLGPRRKPAKGPGGTAELEPLQLNAVLGQDLPEFFFHAGQAAADLSAEFRAAPLAAGMPPQFAQQPADPCRQLRAASQVDRCVLGRRPIARGGPNPSLPARHAIVRAQPSPAIRSPSGLHGALPREKRRLGKDLRPNLLKAGLDFLGGRKRSFHFLVSICW
jgi:hypothetical protein